MKFEENYTVDSTVFGILHEDLRDAYNHYVQTEVAKRGLFAPTSKEEIIEKASRKFVPKTFAYQEGRLTELKKSVQSVTIDGKELVFEIFEHDGRKVIQPKAFTSTPEVVSANNAERYVISMDGDRLYSIDPVTLHAEKITSDTLEGFSIDDFFEISPHVFWASLPSLNSGGSHLIYYSNKSVRDGKPELTNGLWLYSFDDQTEKPILSDRDFEGGDFVAPQSFIVKTPPKPFFRRCRMIYFETSRLLLRDWEEKDFEPFCRLNADEEVMKYFPKTLSTEETDRFYQTILAEFKECGFGLYAVEVKETKDFIGFIGFHRATFEADFTPCIEIGWRLKKEAWGKGYATEGASACLRYGFHHLGFDEVYSFTADVNTPSKNVMRKIGMEFMATFHHPNVEKDSPLSKHVLFHIHKHRFR